MKRVAITGSTGLVGSRIMELLHEKFLFVPLSQPLVDITNKKSVESALSSIEYDTILHLAAYTDVDKAQYDQNSAHDVNVIGTNNIFSAAQTQKKPMIYISTDFVFDGNRPPYLETSIPQPISVYGETKYEAEKIVQKNAMIVRISYPYKAQCLEKKDFVHKIKEQLTHGNTLHMVHDSLITPTYIDDIAYALSYLIENYTPQIFHVVGTHTLSPYDAGLLIARTFGLNKQLIHPASFASFFQNRAQRPQFSDMKSAENTFYTMKTFEQGLSTFIKD